MKYKVVAVTGGIGSGKSVVCRILRESGFDVYDCDMRARVIMDSSPQIKDALRTCISPLAVDADGNIDRKQIAGIVFSDKIKLQALNSIVHQCVRDDFERWISGRQDRPVFVETAILYESGLDRLADEIWNVICPDMQMRVNRVRLRDAATIEQVMKRIAAQRAEEQALATECRVPVYELVNDGSRSLLLQIDSLLQD